MSPKSFLLSRAFLIPAGLILPFTARAADLFWSNPDTGSFTDPANWSTGVVPTTADNAFISNGGTSQIGPDIVSVRSLRVEAGSLELNDSFLTTEVTSSGWQSNGDLQVGAVAGQVGSLTASGSTSITTGRVRIGGWNEGSDQGDMHGHLVMSGGSALSTAPGNDFWLGNGTGSSATLEMSDLAQISVLNSGTAGRANASATATQSGHSVFSTQGSFAFGETGGTTTWTVKDNAELAIGGNVAIADGGTSQGRINVQNEAKLSSGNELWVGNGAGATGELNITGGEVQSASWIAIGREGAKGTLNMSGGSLTKNGTADNHFVTNGSASQVATINHSGGTISNVVSEMRLSENSGNVTEWTATGGVGTFAVVEVGRSGVATLTIGGTAAYTATTVRVGANGGSAGTLNLNGGSLTATSITKGGGNGTVNFSGGTLRAGANSADFISGFTPGSVVIQSGGAVVDTNSFNVTITLALTGDGGFTKVGAGSLTLSGANTYLGATSVNGGTLSITTGFLNDLADVSVGAGSVLNLNFAGTDTVKALFLDGNAMEIGTWGAVGSGATHQSAFFTGSGLLNVTAVPEPSTVALLIMGFGAAGWGLRRRRA